METGHTEFPSGNILASAPWRKVVHVSGEVSMQSPCSVFGRLFGLCILYFFLKAAV